MLESCDLSQRNRRMMLPLGAFVVVFALAFALAANAGKPPQAQSQGAAAVPSTYQYDVVSVKPNTSGGRGGSTISPDGFSRRATTLTSLIYTAYALRFPEQLIGAPPWISSDKFDVDTKMDGSVMDALQKMSQDDRSAARRQMMQGLLADRFKLTVHLETRELPVYTLVIAKGGLKMKEATPGDTYPNGLKILGGAGGMVYQTGPSGLMITAQAAAVAQLIPNISREVGRIVLDKTGLTGNYDFIFQFTPEAYRVPSNLGEGGGSVPLPPDFGAISIFTAVQEQLGLKLESVKASIDVVVIDHVERPSGN